MYRNRKSRGQCITEMIVGSTMMVPVMLFGLDILTLGLTASINDHLAKDAARAAANQVNEASARLAANMVVARLKKSAIITDAQIVGGRVDYVPNDKVTVTTQLSIKVPAPFPFFDGGNFVARAQEPIVGNPVNYAEQTK